MDFHFSFLFSFFFSCGQVMGFDGRCVCFVEPVCCYAAFFFFFWGGVGGDEILNRIG